MRNYVVEGNTVNGGAAIEVVAQPGVATESISFTGVPTLGTGQTVKLVWTVTENNRIWTREETLLPVGSAYVLNITNEMESLVGHSIGARLRVEFAYASWLSGPFTISILPETHITTLPELVDIVADHTTALAANATTVAGHTTTIGQHTTTIGTHTTQIAALKSPAIVEVTESKTLVLTDAATVQKVTGALATTITIPLNAAVAFPVGTEITILSWTESDVNVAIAEGGTVHSISEYKKISAQYGAATLKKLAEDSWVLYGSLKA